MTYGIYSITYTTTGERYVGSSINVENRWSEHKTDLRRGDHCNPRLQNIVRKHGLEALEFEIVEVCEVGTLFEREQYHVDCGAELNLATVVKNPMEGRRHSEETKKKMSESQLDKWQDPKHLEKMAVVFNRPERIAKISAFNKGKTLSKEAKAKISAKNKGRMPSPENLEKLWAARQQYYLNRRSKAD